MTSGRVKLRPLVADDIPACVQLVGLAFQGDKNTEFKARSIRGPYDHEKGTRDGLNHWLQKEPRDVEMSVAVDTDSGEVLGCVGWGFRGFNTPSAEQQQRDPDGPRRSPPATQPPSQTKETERDDEPVSMRKRLESHTSADLQAWMQRLMPPGTKCMFIASIAVHPAHHGKGVGSALLRKGTDRADAEGVFCWVHSSEAGAAFFPRFGFEEVGRLEVDLDAFNSDNIPAPESQSAGWGNYTFRYYRREAQRPSV